MNTDTHEISPRLASLIRAARHSVPDESARVDAQRRLGQRLQARRPRQRAPGLVWAGAAGALLVAAALLLLPLLSGNRGVAFAAVQQKLLNFRTLHATIHQRAGGFDLPTLRVWSDQAGNTRSEIGDSTSVVVNVRQKQLMILLHGAHKAMRMPLDAGPDPSEDPLGWLDAVRRFQGQATHLARTRTIDGVTTDGWKLDTAGMHITLWADHDGMPRAVDIDGQADLHQQIAIELDRPIDASRFSTELPAGYTLARQD